MMRIDLGALVLLVLHVVLFGDSSSVCDINESSLTTSAVQDGKWVNLHNS